MEFRQFRCSVDDYVPQLARILRIHLVLSSRRTSLLIRMRVRLFLSFQLLLCVFTTVSGFGFGLLLGAGRPKIGPLGTLFGGASLNPGAGST